MTVTDEVTLFSICPQCVRFIVYLSFWAMVAVAAIVTNIFVVPYLAEGPADGSTCPPFSRDLPDFGVGVSPGVGFDFKTQSHLEELFAYKNICANWDYSPAREIIASIYPLVEYPILLFICMEFLIVWVSHNKGDVRSWLYTTSKIIFPINLFLASQFRMIFVFVAYENVKMHTIGFLGFQICLMLMAIQTVLYIVETDNEIKNRFCGKYTKHGAIAFIIGDLIIFAFKIPATSYVVHHGRGAPWTIKDTFIGGMKVGEIVDLIWMIFNALAPLIVSFVRMMRDRKHKLNYLEFTVKFKTAHRDEVDVDGETQVPNGPNTIIMK